MYDYGIGVTIWINSKIACVTGWTMYSCPNIQKGISNVNCLQNNEREIQAAGSQKFS